MVLDLGEQAGILDRHNRLRGEGLEQVDGAGPQTPPGASAVHDQRADTRRNAERHQAAAPVKPAAGLSRSAALPPARAGPASGLLRVSRRQATRGGEISARFVAHRPIISALMRTWPLSEILYSSLET